MQSRWTFLSRTPELDVDVMTRLGTLSSGLEPVELDPRFRSELRVLLLAQAERMRDERARAGVGEIAVAKPVRATGAASRLWRRTLAVGAATTLTAGGLAIASDAPRQPVPGVALTTSAGSSTAPGGAPVVSRSRGTAALPVDPLGPATTMLAASASALDHAVREHADPAVVASRLRALSGSTTAAVALVRHLAAPRPGLPVVDGPLGSRLATAADEATRASQAVLNAGPWLVNLRPAASALLRAVRVLRTATGPRGASGLTGAEGLGGATSLGGSTSLGGATTPARSPAPTAVGGRPPGSPVPPTTLLPTAGSPAPAGPSAATGTVSPTGSLPATEVPAHTLPRTSLPPSFSFSIRVLSTVQAPSDPRAPQPTVAPLP